MQNLTAILAVIGVCALASTAAAQSPAPDAEQKPAPSATTVDGLEDLQKAASDLSRAVEAVVASAAANPELKAAALKVAAGAVGVAQQSLADQLKMIQVALSAAAREIAAAQTANAQKATQPAQTPSK